MENENVHKEGDETNMIPNDGEKLERRRRGKKRNNRTYIFDDEKFGRRRRGKKRLNRTPVFDDNGVKVESNMCHQCQRNDNGRVVRCTLCKTKRFCIPCMSSWYPQMTEVQIAEACPVCLHNCNCKSCLRMNGPVKMLTNHFEVPPKEKIQHAKNLLVAILPCLKQINLEQMAEREIEASIQGVLAGEISISTGVCGRDERILCNNCRAAIMDYHRSCPDCSYDLCLACCREIRAGQLRECEEIIMEYSDRLPNDREECLGLSHRCSNKLRKVAKSQVVSMHSDSTSGKPVWKADENGRIHCPPVDYEGCGFGVLELKSILSENRVSNLVNEVEKIVTSFEEVDLPEAPHPSSFSDSVCDVVAECNLRKCAFRESCNDNYLYCPDARDIQQGNLKNFQLHWARGEPVIIRSVLETTPGLSWEPFVMWRALRQITNAKHATLLDVKAVDCLEWCEVDVNLRSFFTGYTSGQFDSCNWPVMLKLKDWPPDGMFEEHLPRHGAEFIRALPYKEYTHPRDGVLNLAAIWPSEYLKPDLDPKLHIGYGFQQELGRGDSVTKLHCDMSDVVNVLMHTAEVSLAPQNLKAISKLKRRMYALDQKELFGKEFPENGTSCENKQMNHDVPSSVTSEHENTRKCISDPKGKSTLDSFSKHGHESKSSDFSNEVGNQACLGNKSTNIKELDGNIGGSKGDMVDDETSQSTHVSVNRDTTFSNEASFSQSTEVESSSGADNGGALWDIFRREDVSKLQEFLNAHHREFRHICCAPLEQVIHPIYDQSFYLTEEHKRKLKKEYGIEPWTFIQNLGEAVFIPAGCPYQVRNLKSCIQVALGFVSPENVQECIRLVEEFRVLPQNHREKECQMEVKKMCIFGAEKAVQDILNAENDYRYSLYQKKK